MINKIATSTEILGAFLSADVKGNVAQLKTNTGEFIADNYGVDLSDVVLDVVENDEETMHLSLPYYASLESVSVSGIDESELALVSGTEPIAIIIGLVATAGAAAVVGGASALVGVNARVSK